MSSANTPMDGTAIRAFLKARNAVAVHFSTVMTRHQTLLYPDDLRQAMALSGIALSFSTIQPGDTHRLQGKGGAEGSVGMLVDFGPNTIVESVAPDDSGSIWDPATATSGSLGHMPTSESCAASIDDRTESNEWLIKNYIPKGILILPPVLVRKHFILDDGDFLSEAEISLEEAIAPFPDQRIFGARPDSFVEYDRTVRGWKPVSYDQMFSDS